MGDARASVSWGASIPSALYYDDTPPVFQFTDTTCAICMDNVKNRVFVNSCSHAFCLGCILKWSKEKLQCPLCKQPFCVVYFCVVSQGVFKRIPFRCLIQPSERHCSGELGFNCSQFGRIKRLLQFGNMVTHDSDVLAINREYMVRTNPYYFREAVYVNNYWALSYENSSKWLEPNFYLENPDFVVRLFPWIYRELEVLLTGTDRSIDEAFNLIVSMLHIHEVYSAKCVNYLKPFLGDQTHHFLHEFLNFIGSRMPMPIYDKVVQYSSVYFLRGNAFRGAVVDGPGEYKELIMFDQNERPVVSQGLRVKRGNSCFPTIKYEDVVALTPQKHAGSRMYILSDPGDECIRIEEVLCDSQCKLEPAYSLWTASQTDDLVTYSSDNPHLHIEAIMYTDKKKRV